MLQVLPSHKGQLPDEPDWSRYFGVELEFVPGASMLAHRVSLYRRGIDTFDDSCDILGVVRGNYRNGPKRFRDTLTCESGRSCRGRIGHLINLFGHGNTHVAEALSDVHDEEFQALHADWNGLSLREIAARSREHPVLFERKLLDLFPALTNKQRRYWNLGTDPSAGYELRTIPLNGREGWAAIADACEGITDLDGSVNDSCGGHIHQDMTDEPAEVTGRLLTAYRFIEPLLAAPVNPTRYYERAYNRPSWDSRPLSTNDVRHVMSDKQASTHYGTRWLATQQLAHHGSFEFRGLEGTLDPATFKNYAIILNRFIQATKAGSWGVKVRNVAPIGVSSDSILGFLRYLDLTRSGICDDLKEARDWYLSRIREFKDREPFQQYLIVGATSRGDNRRSLASLKELRNTGIHQQTVVVTPKAEKQEELPDKELGIQISQIIHRIMVSSRANVADDRNLGGTQVIDEERLFEYFDDALEAIGLLENHDYDDAINRGRYQWMTVTADGETNRMMNEFWTAFRTYDFATLGAWWKAHLYHNGEPNIPRIEGISIVIVEWLATWATRYPNWENVRNAFTTGDASCVDF